MQDSNQFAGRFLGVLGGMGPLAGATFVNRLVLLTPATSDQHHIPAILWNDPRVPGRPAAFLHQGEDPLPWMLNGIRHLEQAGAQAIAIPCNTAHLWFDAMQARTRLPILHIVDAVMANLRDSGITDGRVGLLATGATLASQLYQTALTANGYECVVPESDEIERWCTAPIGLVKENRLDDAQEALTPGVAALHGRGVQAVILGCTELPLALPLARRTWDMPIVDSIDALARAAIAWYFDSSLAPYSPSN